MGIIIDAVKYVVKHPFAARSRFTTLIVEVSRWREVFAEQAYLWLAQRMVDGTTVIDIGANIGDTATYFAQFPTCARVVAYEPYPATYKLMLKYVALSPLKDKIETHNAAVADKAGKLRISNSEIDSPGFTLESMRAKTGKEVPIIPLNDCLRGKKRVVIKCDAEGIEKRLFDGADLKEVYAIMLEWHGSEARDAARTALLKHGFDIKVTQTSSGAATVDKLEGGMGYIYAHRTHKK